MTQQPLGNEPGTRSPIILLPAYNDWEACGLLLRELDRALESAQLRAHLLIVDDGSTAPPDLSSQTHPLRAVRSVDILRLARNTGHQRAICLGLCVLATSEDARPVVIMDADGEDDPSDVPRLLEAWEREGGKKIIFAERRRRSESMVFRVAYWAYRVVHRVLTGVSVRVGNFSVLPRSALPGLTAFPELWSHFAAAVFVSRIPFTTLPTNRAQRLVGKSRMNFVSLVGHGLSAIAVFSEVVGVRVLLGSLMLIGLGGLGLGVLTAAHLLTPWAAPAWALYVAAIIGPALLLVIMFAFLFTFVILADRKGAAMLPARDFDHFVEGTHWIYTPEGEVDLGLRF